MSKDFNRVIRLWKKEYTSQITKYSEYKATEQFKKITSLFAPGKNYFYILNFHNLELDYLSPGIKDFVNKPISEITMDDLLALALPEDIAVIEQKERVVKDFYGRFIDPEDITSYKLVYSYRIRDFRGKCRTMIHQATPLSTDENQAPQHILGLHTDISHLQAASTTDLSFIHLGEGKSYYNVKIDKGYFDPDLKEFEDEELSELLSHREKEVVNCLAQGLNAEQIGERLHISVHTVTTHRKNILQKTGCTNTAHLVAKCITGGVVSVNS